MNYAKKKLASDLQEIRRKNRETPLSEAPDITAVHVPPYTPSDAVKKFNAELAVYHQRVKDKFFGEIR
jgi:hypothetical protein